MYYATYKDIGETDIAAFKTERERDNWVNFKDPFSQTFYINADNCTFERAAMTAEEAEKRIGTMLHKKDEFNDGQEWYYMVY